MFVPKVSRVVRSGELFPHCWQRRERIAVLPICQSMLLHVITTLRFFCLFYKFKLKIKKGDQNLLKIFRK